MQVAGINANPHIPVHAGLAKFLKEHKAWNDKWTVRQGQLTTETGRDSRRERRAVSRGFPLRRICGWSFEIDRRPEAAHPAGRFDDDGPAPHAR